MNQPQLPTVTAPDPSQWMTVPEVCAYLDVHRGTVYDYVKRGVMGDYKIGHNRVIWHEDAHKAKRALDALRGLGG